MMFLDRARVRVKAGDGGKGVISFRREAHVPRGGPDGGDGGHGGNVVLKVDEGLTTLSEFRFARTFSAPSGGSGSGSNRRGKSERDLVLRVPPGTVVTDLGTGERVGDLVAPEEELVVARGGRGGRGNARFVSSTRQVPRIAEDGEPGEEREVELELKLIADVGLVGLPNAGKSSLLAAMTRARPKIADYPFTTLTPNLGVAGLDERELVVADIPGLIEGAHRGAGLGEEFLRHVERTRVLVHVIDASRDDPLADVATIEAELAAYGRGLAERPRIHALNKIDLAEARAHLPALQERLADARPVSAATGEGVRELLALVFA
ncbi:MAG: GTPase ObgE, partial [Candidatus Limnocylindria bacterium]